MGNNAKALGVLCFAKFEGGPCGNEAPLFILNNKGISTHPRTTSEMENIYDVGSHWYPENKKAFEKLTVLQVKSGGDVKVEGENRNMLLGIAKKKKRRRPPVPSH